MTSANDNQKRPSPLLTAAIAVVLVFGIALSWAACSVYQTVQEIEETYEQASERATNARDAFLGILDRDGCPEDPPSYADVIADTASEFSYQELMTREGNRALAEKIEENWGGMKARWRANWDEVNGLYEEYEAELRLLETREDHNPDAWTPARQLLNQECP